MQPGTPDPLRRAMLKGAVAQLREDKLLKEEAEQSSAAISSKIPKVEAVELPEGTEITYRGEKVKLQDGRLFYVRGARFKVIFAKSAEGDLIQIVQEKTPQEVDI